MKNENPRLNLVLCWHMHQPWYRESQDGQYRLPWVYLHALKDYVDMAAHLEAHPKMRCVVNFTPVLLEQLDDYATQFKRHLESGSRFSDPLLNLLAGTEPVPTDAEARDLAIGGMMGRCWREFMLPLYLGLGLGQFLKRDPSMPDEAVDLEYLADNLWFVGSPETVAEQIMNLQAQTGGFGHLTIVSYDASDERETWDRSLRLLMSDVLPRCQVAEPPLQNYARG